MTETAGGARITAANRLLIVGMTGSGKSELARYLFSLFRVRRVLIDSKAEWVVPGQPAPRLPRCANADQAAQLVAAIDWAAPIVHLQPAWQDWHALEAIYARCDTMPGALVVWTDEAYGVSSANQRPAGLIAYQVTGRGKRHGHIVATQRPRNIARELITEADHLFIVKRQIATPDLAAALEGAPFLTPHQALELYQQLPEHGYLWIDRARGDVAIGDPLPEQLRRTPGPRKLEA